MTTQEPGMTPDETPTPKTKPEFGGFEGLLRLIESMPPKPPRLGFGLDELFAIPVAPKAPPKKDKKHKTLAVIYLDGSEAFFTMHSWNVNKNDGLLNIRVCEADWPGVRRMSVPLGNIKCFRVED